MPEKTKIELEKENQELKKKIEKLENHLDNIINFSSILPKRDLNVCVNTHGADFIVRTIENDILYSHRKLAEYSEKAKKKYRIRRKK